MTAATMQGDRPPARVRHSWRCVPAGPYHEEIRELSTGRALVLTVCTSCGGTDLEHQLRTDTDRETTP